MKNIDKTSLNIVNENIQMINELFPDVFIDGKIDFEKLKSLLGEYIETSNEKYIFNWIGKNESLKYAQSPSTGTLLPLIGKSKNWKGTQNLYIEGDNAEVLKLLQKTYFGKIKMIYIDPPYNTGIDFVYKDDFHDNITNYKKISNQTNRANADTNGRFHTDWLNMMYSRLILARNLLKEDGVIFISIDDHELANLKKLCDEIFGPDNFVSNMIWQSTAGSNTGTDIVTVTEYILVYTKNRDCFKFNGMLASEQSYTLEDEYVNTRGKYALDKLDRRRVGSHYSDALNYGIEMPDGTIRYPGGGITKSSEGWNYLWSKSKVQWGLENGFIEFKNVNGEWNVYNKRYSKIDNEGNPIERTIPFRNMITSDQFNTAQGTAELRNLFNFRPFDFPKPSALIKHLLMTAVRLDKDAIILDFFSGSGTTAEAVMKMNAEDNGNRKFIMVQLPENYVDESEAFKNGYKNICEIGEERIRRAGQKIYNELKEKYDNAGLLVNECINPDDLDLGFKVFKLESTNIRPWDGSLKIDDQTIFDFADTIKEDRSNLDVAYEIMLKYGIFNMPLKEVQINNKTMYNIGEGFMIICLEDEVTIEDVTEIAKQKPHCVVFKEEGFEDDNVKINATYTLERMGVEDVKCI